MSININHETETITATSGTVTIAGTLAGSLPASSYDYVKAYLTSNFVPTTDTTSKVPFDQTTINYNSYFDTVTNHRYTPLIAGYYRILFNCVFNTNNVTNATYTAYIYKKTSPVAAAYWEAPQTAGLGGGLETSMCCETLEYMNGIDDYIECWVTPTGYGPYPPTVYSSVYNSSVIINKV